MKFTMNRSRNVSGFGHSIDFVKGEPMHVPPELYALVIAAGAVSEDENFDVEPPKSKLPTAPADPTARKEAILEAIELLVSTNESTNFTAGGAPHTKALEGILGWEVGAKERDTLWVEFKTRDDK